MPSFGRTASDNAGETDSAARLDALTRTSSDSAAAVDAATGMLVASASDAAPAVDAATRPAASRNRTVRDSAPAGDSGTAAVVRAHAVWARQRIFAGKALPASGVWARSRGWTATASPAATTGWTRTRGFVGTVTVTQTASVTTGVGYEINGRTRDWEGVATVTADPVPPPAHVGYLPTLQETYPAPTIINGQPYADASKNPWLPSSVVHGFWGAYDIVIAGVNVTYFRDDARGNPIQTIITKLSDKDPGGDDLCDLVFAGITTFDTYGVGDLAWLYTDAAVTIRKLNTSGAVVGTAFEGVIAPIEDDQQPRSPSLTTLHCVGIWTRLDDFITLPRPSIDQYVRPIPVGHLTPIDSAQFIYAHVHRAQLFGWPGKMVKPANSGILTGEQGAYGEPIASRTIQMMLSQMQRSATTFYTITNQRSRKLALTTRTWSTHVDFSMRAGQRGESHNLVIDPTTAHNAFYGQGEAPFGSVDPTIGRPDAIASWENWQYPFAPTAIPPYPLPSGQNFNAGDGHTGFQAFSDELRSRGYDLDSQNTYRTSDVDEVERFQSNAGIQVDGIVGPQTWNQAFQTGINARVLAQAYIKELYTTSPYSPFRTNARGGITGPNPGFDPLRHPRREVLEQFGSLKKADAIRSVKEEYALIHTPIYRGTVTATNIDPPEMCALDTRSGMTMVLKNHKGTDRHLYVAQVDRVPGMVAGSDRTVAWTVSEIPEGLMTLAQRLARRQGIKDLVASIRPPRHGSRQIPSWPAFDAESGAGIFLPGQAQTGGLWNKYLIPMGGQVDVSAVKIVASADTKMAAAVFANPYLTVQHLIALPGLADPSSGTDDPWAVNQKKLLDFGICWATGNPNAMQGYWPNDPSGTLTGVLADTAPWQYRANGVWGALFVWTEASCRVNGDPASKYRAIFPAPAQ